jgi:hypothetical protein
VGCQLTRDPVDRKQDLGKEIFNYSAGGGTLLERYADGHDEPHIHDRFNPCAEGVTRDLCIRFEWPRGSELKTLHKLWVQKPALKKVVLRDMEEAMFVPVAEFAQQRKMRLPAVVGLQTLHHCLDIWAGASDLVLRAGEELGGAADRKGNVVFFGFRTPGPDGELHELECKVIKRRAQVVQAVPDEDAEERFRSADLSNAEDVLTSFRIAVLVEGFKCSIDERLLGFFERTEVTTRSFNLGFDPFKPIHELRMPVGRR